MQGGDAFIIGIIIGVMFIHKKDRKIKKIIGGNT
jgi:hypothetical protein